MFIFLSITVPVSVFSVSMFLIFLSPIFTSFTITGSKAQVGTNSKLVKPAYMQVFDYLQQDISDGHAFLTILQNITIASTIDIYKRI